LDAISIVPTRRTRDPEDVSLDWQIDAFKFSMPVIGAPLDSVMSPAPAIQLGQLGGTGVLNLEGLWTRYADPQPVLEETAVLQAQQGARENPARLQELYAAPSQAELISARLEGIRDAGVVVAAAPTPRRTQEFYKTVVAPGVGMFVIRG